MDPVDDLLQERLARLEAGEPLENCLVGLPPGEADLLNKAARLRAIAASAPASESHAASRKELLRMADQTSKMASQPPAQKPPLPRWLMPAALAGSAFTLLSCMVIFSLLAGLAGLRWFNRSIAGKQEQAPLSQGVPSTSARPVPTATIPLAAPDAQSALLAGVRGFVEIQAGDGAWARVETGYILKAGHRLRTGPLSSVTLEFFDGSQAQVEQSSEISLDELDAPKSGPRVILLTQWLGDSQHEVAHNSDPASRYEVRTPSGSGTAKGTSFHVFVSAALFVRFDVDEGAVDVANLDVNRIVVAGQSTIIISGQPPAEPFFRMSGEGEVEQIGPEWIIAGRTFQTHESTVIIGQPDVGDWVSFQARILPDDTLVADLIVLLGDTPENRFGFSGRVDAMTDSEWTVSGRVVRIGEFTRINDDDIRTGDLVEIIGIITEDGSLLASRIRLLEDEHGFPFEFTGVVQSVADSVWMVSNIPIAIDTATRIEPGLTAGDTVEVKGRILNDGKWLASSIEAAEEHEREFAITGEVESIDPWRVAGIDLLTNDKTEIDDEIAAGDRVRVEGRVLEDGSWLAREIELLEENRPAHFHFIAIVSSIDPWIVGGITLEANEHSQVTGNVQIGKVVRVQGVVLPDGTWLIEKIEGQELHLGCLEFSTVVRSVDSAQVILLDMQEISLDEHIHIEGELKIATVVIISGCAGVDGNFTFISIIVVYQLDQVPVIIIKPPEHEHHDDDDDDDD